MNKLENWILKRIIRNEVRQGFYHDIKITNLYSLIRNACKEEFIEDNEPTLDSFLKDCFNRTSKIKNHIRRPIHRSKYWEWCDTCERPKRKGIACEM